MRFLSRLGALLTPLGCATVALLVLSAPVSGQQFAEGNVPAPELEGKEWLNTTDGKPIALSSRKGRVTIVQFWTFGCINCQRNLPAYSRWQKKFKEKEVVILGVHTPETESERKTENVARFVKENNITYPVLLDTDLKNWKRWEQRYWPTVYLIDRKGNVRFRWEGELEWRGAGGEKKMEAKIRALLAEKK